MIRRIDIVGAIGIAVCLCGCSRPYTRDLEDAARSITEQESHFMLADPRMSNEWVNALYETNAPLCVERGLVRLGDDTILRFAFVSHHLTKDHESHTVFLGSNYFRNVTGYFCCEVQFGECNVPKDITAFDRLLDEVDGSSP